MKLFQGDKRTVKAKKNMVASFFLKGLDGVIYLAVVPLTLGFLDPYSYGLWLTINSILIWINSFDIGLGNGLRNCLTKALAAKDYEKCRIYISTTYFLLCLIVAIILSIFYIANCFLDWYSILNVDKSVIPDLQEVIMYSFALFGISFVLKIISSIYLALQLPAISNAFNAMGYVVSLLMLLILRMTMESGTLMLVAVIFSASPCLVYFVVTPITFWKYKPELCPSLRHIRLKGYLNELLVVGVNFFVMHICVIVLQFSTNLVISNLFGPQQVTPYNIANRYMYIGIILMSIILAPIWSAVTDAHACGDWNWIRQTLKKIERTMLLLGLFLLGLIIISGPVYHIWIGDDVEIPFMMTVLNGIYVFLLIWSTGQSTFLNGLNILRVQLYANIFQALIFFPLVFTLGNEFGIYGLVVGLIIANLPAAITNTVQVKMIMNNKANGIWSK